MGSLKKRRKTKINKHKRKKRMRALKAVLAPFGSCQDFAD